VAAERKQLDQTRTAELAEAVAEREIATSSDSAAYARVLGLGPCAADLYWPLRRRSRGTDDIGAAASLALYEAGLLDELPAGASQGSAATGAWRAFTTRIAIEPDQRARVRAALVDSDRRVRSAAIKAIVANPLPGDERVLLEVVRLDPELSLRQNALQALGDMGALETLLDAREYWDHMVEASRLAYLQALSAPLSLRRGGEKILGLVMESDDSMPGVVAASLLVRRPAPEAGYAFSKLLRDLRGGTVSERLLALASLPPSDPDVLAEIRNVAKSDSAHLRTAALEVMLKLPGETGLALKRLKAIEASKDADALDAAQILAVLGDEPSILRVEQQLSAPLAAERLSAARLLLRIKHWRAVARALTDDHPTVRLAVACEVLQAH
jgi:hypothetical protein